jgi:peptide subunit release factor RF-3
MTSWGYIIMIAAVILGLRSAMDVRHRYRVAFMVVIAAVVFSALRQHAY